jgi:hypothetical protein
MGARDDHATDGRMPSCFARKELDEDRGTFTFDPFVAYGLQGMLKRRVVVSGVAVSMDSRKPADCRGTKRDILFIGVAGGSPDGVERPLVDAAVVPVAASDIAICSSVV